MVEVRSRFDESITKPLTQLQMRRLRWFILIFPLIFCFIGIMAVVAPNDPGDEGFGIFMIVFSVLFIPLVWWLSKGLQKVVNKSMKIMNVETMCYFRFDENKIYQHIVRGEEFKDTSESSYSMLYKAFETRSHFFLYISNMQTHVIPKKDIILGTAQELASILFGKLGKKFKVLKIK